MCCFHVVEDDYPPKCVLMCYANLSAAFEFEEVPFGFGGLHTAIPTLMNE